MEDSNKQSDKTSLFIGFSEDIHPQSRPVRSKGCRPVRQCFFNAVLLTFIAAGIPLFVHLYLKCAALESRLEHLERVLDPSRGSESPNIPSRTEWWDDVSERPAGESSKGEGTQSEGGRRDANGNFLDEVDGSYKDPVNGDEFENYVYDSDDLPLTDHNTDDAIPSAPPTLLTPRLPNDDVINPDNVRAVVRKRRAAKPSGSGRGSNAPTELGKTNDMMDDEQGGMTPVKTTKKEKRSRSAPSILHMHLDLGNISQEQQSLLDRRLINHIELDFGRLTLEGYQPYEVRDGGSTHHVYNEWNPGNWSTANKDFQYHIRTGRIEILKPGIYYIYSQLCYHNRAARSGYNIMTSRPSGSTPRSIHVKHSLAMCMTSVTMPPLSMPNGTVIHPEDKTCHTGVVAKLDAHNTVFIEDMYRQVIATYESANFFGIYKIENV